MLLTEFPLQCNGNSRIGQGGISDYYKITKLRLEGDFLLPASSRRIGACTGAEFAVKTMSYTQTRENFASTLGFVLDDREEVVVSRAGKDPVVIASLEDYESLRETAYLLWNPVNARRSFGSIERLEAGQGIVQDLVE
jgi:antitoxin YefM